MDVNKCENFIENVWEESIIPTLQEYIAIPNKSPIFDSNWQENKYMDQAVDLIKKWCMKHSPKGMTLEVLQEEDKTPLIYIEIDGNSAKDTILLYGHLDKQPEMTGWDDDLGPWKPVIKNDKLYGRGGADDGYSVFSALTAINALQEQALEHPRCVIIIEASEESGSNDLPYYVSNLKSRIGEPSLIICLDSGCANYEQMWITTSLRGIIGGKLKVQVTEEGLHSGLASGIVPCSFRIARQLLSRIEDQDTGELLLPDLNIEIPEERISQSKATAKILQKQVYQELPFADLTKPVSEDITQLIINRTWRPFLTVTGIDGLPSIEQAGNVLRTFTEIKISIRIPPTVVAKDAAKVVKSVLENEPPYDANVSFEVEDVASGWNAPESKDWLISAADKASREFFGKEAHYIGEGGTIPFMGMLGEMFPKAQFIITGVLGPKSNAHGPNEFLHLPYVQKLTGSIAYIISTYCKKNT